MEGVVAKRRSSVYQPGRRAHTWLKIKQHPAQEVVIGGWRPGQGRREGGVGALLIGIPTDEGLRYRRPGRLRLQRPACSTRSQDLLAPLARKSSARFSTYRARTPGTRTG